MLHLYVYCMLCMCAANTSSIAVDPWSVFVCICMLLLFAAVCVFVCMYVFTAQPQYKRGHRKTASFGTILDVPKIVVTGTTGQLGFLVTLLGFGLLCSDMTLSCVSLYDTNLIMFIDINVLRVLVVSLQRRLNLSWSDTHLSYSVSLSLHETEFFLLSAKAEPELISSVSTFYTNNLVLIFLRC